MKTGTETAVSDSDFSTPVLATTLLARDICRLSTAPLDPEVLHQARRCVLDQLGCALAGQDHPAVRAVRSVVQRRFPGDQAHGWFTGAGFSTTGAAWLNSIAGTILDLDDGNRQAMGHPGGAVIPAALAIAQETGSDTDTILRAIIAGYEVAVRVGAAEQVPSYHSGNYTSFGVAAAAGVLLGLNEAQLAHALAICAYHGPRVSDLTLSADMGSNVKESMPWSVPVGITAADLAAAGFTGNRDALDIEERIDRAALLAGLGDQPLILRTYFKKYSACRWAHSAVEALLSLMAEHRLVPGDIGSVEVETFRAAARLNNRADPPTLESAQYSVPYSMALVALRGETSLMPIRADALRDTEVVEFARRITIRETDRMTAMFPAQVPASVTIHAGGRLYKSEVFAPWGEASRAPSDDELRSKFAMIAEMRIDKARADAICEAVLDAGNDPVPLFAALAGPLADQTQD